MWCLGAAFSQLNETHKVVIRNGLGEPMSCLCMWDTAVRETNLFECDVAKKLKELKMQWSSFYGYAFHPFILIAQCLKKVGGREPLSSWSYPSGQPASGILVWWDSWWHHQCISQWDVWAYQVRRLQHPLTKMRLMACKLSDNPLNWKGYQWKSGNFL